MHGEPCATGLQVAATEYSRMIGPPMRGFGRPRMEFIAITGNDQRKLRVHLVCERDQTHDQPLSSIIDVHLQPVVDESARDRNSEWQLGKSGAQLLARKPLHVLQLSIIQYNVRRRCLGNEAEHQR